MAHYIIMLVSLYSHAHTNHGCATHLNKPALMTLTMIRDATMRICNTSNLNLWMTCHVHKLALPASFEYSLYHGTAAVAT